MARGPVSLQAKWFVLDTGELVVGKPKTGVDAVKIKPLSKLAWFDARAKIEDNRITREAAEIVMLNGVVDWTFPAICDDVNILDLDEATFDQTLDKIIELTIENVKNGIDSGTSTPRARRRRS